MSDSPREVLAKRLYDNAKVWGARDWADLPEVLRDSWRKSAVAALGALVAAGYVVVPRDPDRISCAPGEANHEGRRVRLERSGYRAHPTLAWDCVAAIDENDWAASAPEFDDYVPLFRLVPSEGDER